MANPFYINSQRRTLQGKSLPMISQDIDSVRTYQWEVSFYNVPVDGVNTIDKPLTLAAKMVSQTGFTSEDIEVHRLNDKVYYPGKVTPDELVVTFDNIYKTRVGNLLYQWMQSIYNPVTGQFTEGRNETMQGNFKIVMDVHETNNLGQPFTHVRYYGVYPKSWKVAERNYATNDFHTVEVTFRYDFMVHVNNNNT